MSLEAENVLCFWNCILIAETSAQTGTWLLTLCCICAGNGFILLNMRSLVLEYEFVVAGSKRQMLNLTNWLF